MLVQYLRITKLVAWLGLAYRKFGYFCIMQLHFTKQKPSQDKQQ